jgi:NAD-dependent DNA ligase
MVRQDARGRKEQAVALEIDADGRVQYAQCDCSFFRRDKLRKGPCPHILAAGVIVAEQVALQAAQQEVQPARMLDPTQFAGKTFVFTGALTLFTRDQAEGLVQARGGTASGSVSKNTTYLVAGDKVGSKLAKAQQLGVPVLTEVQFQEMLEGRV